VDVAPALRELLDAHLVAPAGGDRYRLRHALLEDTVTATLLASQRALLHAGMATVLAARAGESPAEVAAHWASAGNRVEEARWSVVAAWHAEGVYAWPEAIASWRRVWDLWSSLPPGERPSVELSDVAVRCVVAAQRIDDDSLFLRLARDALADGRVTADDEATGRLLRVYGDRLVGTDLTAGLAAQEQAVARFEQTGQPSAEQARALHRFATAKISNGAPSGTEEAELTRAAAIAEQVGALDVMLEMATERSVARLAAGQVEEGIADLTTALRRATEGGAQSGALWTLVTLSDTYLWLLRLDTGVEVGRRGITQLLAHGYRYSIGFSFLLINTVDCLLLRGETLAADELVTAYLLPEVTAAGSPIHLARAELDLLRGDPAAALSRLEAVERLGYHDAEQEMWLAELRAGALLCQGRPRDAGQCAEQGRKRVEGTQCAPRAGWTLVLAARAAADAADLDPAAARDRLARQLRARADEVDCFGPRPDMLRCSANRTTFEGELARLERAGEEGAWRTAKDTWASYGVPHQAGYAGWRLAEALLAEGRRNEAETELAAAYAAAESYVPLRQEIEGLSRRARLTLTDRAAPEPAAASEADTRGLTPRELDVLRLLGSGATNAEIGRKLFMSPKTASVHVTAILRKLGVSGRVQAATVAERMGILGADVDGGRAPR
jgi:DNA-binding CsgD family transcriptional regulator